jgi:hypothetical protein
LLEEFIPNILDLVSVNFESCLLHQEADARQGDLDIEIKTEEGLLLDHRKEMMITLEGYVYVSATVGFPSTGLVVLPGWLGDEL